MSVQVRPTCSTPTAVASFVAPCAMPPTPSHLPSTPSGASIALRLGGPPTTTAMAPLPTTAIVAPAMPSAPPLRDLADPETIMKQKAAYARDLEQQLRRGVEVLGEAHKQQTEALHNRANQEKTRYNLAMDQLVKQQELFLSQEYNEQLMRLQQAAQAKRAELEQQATGLTLEFQQRKVQEEFLAQQLGIQQQHLEAQKQIEEELRKLGLPSTNVDSLVIPMAVPLSAPSTAPRAWSTGTLPVASTAPASTVVLGQQPVTTALTTVAPATPTPILTTAAPAQALSTTGSVATAPTFVAPARSVVAAPTFAGVPHAPMSYVAPVGRLVGSVAGSAVMAISGGTIARPAPLTTSTMPQ